jgi:hypothetical protein
MAAKNFHSVDDLEIELQAMIAALPDAAIEAAVQAMNATLVFLHGEIPPYPPKPEQGGWVAKMPAKSRRFFWWAVKEGRIKGWKWVEDDNGGHPEGSYERKDGIGQKITEEVFTEGDGVRGEIGTNQEYAPWVIGPDYPGEEINGQTMYQAKIHADRWWQLDKVIDDNIGRAWEEFDQVLFDQLSKAFEQQ